MIVVLTLIISDLLPENLLREFLSILTNSIADEMNSSTDSGVPWYHGKDDAILSV